MKPASTPGDSHGGNRIGDMRVIHGTKRRPVASLAYEQRIRDMATRAGYAVLGDGSVWRLCKLDGSEEHGPYVKLPDIATKLRALAGHHQALPLAEEIGRFERFGKGAGGETCRRRAIARDRRMRDVERVATPINERRLAYIKRRHEVHKLRKKYPEIDFDGPRRHQTKERRWHGADGGKAANVAADLRKKLG